MSVITAFKNYRSENSTFFAYTCTYVVFVSYIFFYCYYLWVKKIRQCECAK